MTPAGKDLGRALGKIAVGVGFLAVVVVALLWLAGAFHRKIATTSAPASAQAPPVRSAPDARLAAVRTLRMPRVESSVGTIKAVHEAAVASKLLAKVMDVRVTAGQRVEAGELLVQLDDADLKARLEQAQAAARSAQAARDQARIEHDRVARLYEQSAAPSIELTRVQNTLKSAEAELTRTEQAVTEAMTVLDYAAIRSPINGVIIDKRVEVGDTVSPGQTLLSVYDATKMQLVASVRESLTERIRVGQTVEVEIGALQKRCAGQVSEVVPEAQTASRTFQVKVTGPCPPGIYSGMFGRLLIPLDDEELTVVPRAAVRRIGQLDVVEVEEDGQLRRRAVRLGREFGEDVEVLSGLRSAELVALPATPTKGGP